METVDIKTFEDIVDALNAINRSLDDLWTEIRAIRKERQEGIKFIAEHFPRGFP